MGEFFTRIGRSDPVPPVFSGVFTYNGRPFLHGVSDLSLDPDLVRTVAGLLGREPRGLLDIPVLGPAGQPVVIRVASLVDDKPFPTLFWLVDRTLCYRIDQLEAAGVIAELQHRVDADPGLRTAMERDHQAHIALRRDCMAADTRRRLEELGYAEVLAGKGIGGIADFGRIRCLHTWYAAHLVRPNTVGRLLDAHWADEDGIAAASS